MNTPESTSRDDELSRRLSALEQRISELEAAQQAGFFNSLHRLLAKARPGNQLTGVLAALSIVAVFLFCTSNGLFVGFGNDDVMNLHFAWEPPLRKLILGNLAPFTTFYRPAGALYYLGCYWLFGWSPAAFRAVTYALMILNLALVYQLVSTLSEVPEVGVVAALLYTFHGRLRDVYLNNGTVYDVLSTTLSLLTLTYYVRLRRQSQPRRWWQFGVVLGLFIAAVNAKEMAAIVPGLIFLYELIYHTPSCLKPAALARWVKDHAGTAAVMVVLAMLAFWGKRQPGSVLNGHPAYQPEFSLHRFFVNEQILLSELFYGDRTFNTTGVVMFYVVLFGTAAVSRLKHLWFFAWFALLAPLPVIFIPYRGFFVMYEPLVGLAAYAAAVIVQGRDWIADHIRKRAESGQAWQLRRALTFMVIACLIPLGRNRDFRSMLTPTDPSLLYVAATYKDLMNLHEPLPVHARILLLRCRYPDDAWGPLMMMQMLYHDPAMIVDRPAMMAHKPDESSYGGYDRVIDFDGRKLMVVSKGNSVAANAPPRAMRYPG